MANTSENMQNVLLLVDTMKIKLLLSEALLLQQQHDIKDGGKTARKRKIQHRYRNGCHMAMCTSVVISHLEDVGLNTELPVATQRLPDVYGGYTDIP